MDILQADFLKAFQRMAADVFHQGWHDGGGGNLSYRVSREELAVARESLHEVKEWQPIGVSVPELAGEYFLVTGSGKHMRGVAAAPEGTLALLRLDAKGGRYGIVWGLNHGGRPTSGLPKHLLAHAQKKREGNETSVVYHAHPANLIAMSFLLPPDEKIFTRELWGMMTEAAVVFPEGIGVIPWHLPYSKEQADETRKLMETHRLVLWMHHGTFACTATFDEVFGLMDTAEKAAEIWLKVRAAGGKLQEIPHTGFSQLAEDFHKPVNLSMLD